MLTTFLLGIHMLYFQNRLRNGIAIDLNQGRVHAVNQEKTSVLVKEANRNDIGVYHCELENSQGVGSSLSEITIDVHC